MACRIPRRLRQRFTGGRIRVRARAFRLRHALPIAAKAARGGLFALIASSVPGSAALAQSYPIKPVRLIATYPPGGSSDLMARILAAKLGEIWGQQVLVDNRPGAAGSIGMDYAAHQPADGYSFVIGNLGPAAVNPLISRVPYDTLRDFIAVSLICTGPNILVVNAQAPFRDLPDLLAAARSAPGSLNYGSGGTGSLAHLSGEMLSRAARIQLTHVPYKGGVLAVNDLMGGQLQMVFSDALPVMQPVRAGRLRALAITSANRSGLVPQVPTFAELGYPALVAVNWWGALLPAGTPSPVVGRFHEVLVQALGSAEVRDKFAELGVEAQASSPEAFAERIRSDIERYGQLVREAGLTAD